MSEKTNGSLSSQRVIWAAGLCILVLGIWAEFAAIDQVSHTRGIVVAASRTQIVQSPEGGVLNEIFVHEGDAVQKDQLLAVMEQGRAQAAADDGRAKVAALQITLARLRAEVYGTPLSFSKELKENFPEFIANQTALYQKRQTAINQDLSILNQALELARDELKMNEPLLKSGDIGQVDIIKLKRQIVDLHGQISGKKNRYFQDAQAEMTKAEEELSTQEQVLTERELLLSHSKLHSPVTGIVKNIRVTTVGGVVRAGDPIMDVLPTDSDLIVEAKVPPSELGWIRIGQSATVKFDSFDYSIYGSLKGTVFYISPDSMTEDSKTGEITYYRVRVRIIDQLPSEIRGKPISILPGMTTAVDIKTGERTVMSYLFKPIMKTLDSSLSER